MKKLILFVFLIKFFHCYTGLGFCQKVKSKLQTIDFEKFKAQDVPMEKPTGSPLVTREVEVNCAEQRNLER